MLKHIPLLAAVTLTAAHLFAEKGYGQCTDCVCLSDNTCSNVTRDGNLTSNCSRVEFTPSCTGDYGFYTWTSCTSGNCLNCQSCANLFKIGDSGEIFVANCHTANCNRNDCTYQCTAVTLAEGTTYVLYVCKIPCPGMAEDCTDCDANCAANVCLSYKTGPGPCTP